MAAESDYGLVHHKPLDGELLKKDIETKEYRAFT